MATLHHFLAIIAGGMASAIPLMATRRTGKVEISFLAIEPGTFHFGVPGIDLQKLEITIK